MIQRILQETTSNNKKWWIIIIASSLFLILIAFVIRMCLKRKKKFHFYPQKQNPQKKHEIKNKEDAENIKIDTSVKVFFAIDEEPEKKMDKDEYHNDESEVNLSNVFQLEGEDKQYNRETIQYQTANQKE